MAFDNIDDIEDALKSPSVRDLHAIWEHRQPIPERDARMTGAASRAEGRRIAWLQSNVALARLFTRRALDKEEFLLVCDAAREALRLWSDADADGRTALIGVAMDYATALTRLGFTRAARAELEPFLKDDFQPKLGRTLKADLLLQIGNTLREESHNAAARAVKFQTAQQALEYYQRALDLDPSRLEALVLTAAASLIIGEPGSALREQAHEHGRRILALTATLEDNEGPRVRTTWARAAAHSVLGQIDEARRSYGRLASLEGVTTGQLAEARFRAQFLAEALGQPRDLFKQAFPPLQLIVFAGHLPDLADRPDRPPRFPLADVDLVRKAIRTTLDENDVRVGLVSAAAGADLLFIEALRARSGTVHVVLPWSQEQFRATSVRPFEPPGRDPLWEPLFKRAIDEAATVREIGQVYEPSGDVGWQYTMEVTAGVALHTARVSRLDVQPMVLWNKRPGRGVGGTDSFYGFWRQQLACTPIVLDTPSHALEAATPIGEARSRRCESPTMHQEVKSMLFADIVGYSKLPEHVIPEFVETFLGRVSRLASSSRHAPHSVNTWGDAVYAVFDYARDAGCFALELTRMIEEGKDEWLRKGLYWEEPSAHGGEPVKHPLSIRIGLHTGPVVVHYDPVVRRLGFTGAHVNRAARIEPIAKPGEVFASEEFAALSELDGEIHRRAPGEGAADGRSGFVCEYAGSMHLAKNYQGLYRIHRVVPKREFAIEELARAIHDSYCVQARDAGDTPGTNPSLRAWEDLDDDLREASRAQAADIPIKLMMLGYELAPGHGMAPSEIEADDAQVERLAIREHARWAAERQRQGWTFAPKRDNARKQHPLLIPWEELSEREKEKDRDTIRNLPQLIERAGFRVRRAR